MSILRQLDGPLLVSSVPDGETLSDADFCIMGDGSDSDSDELGHGVGSVTCLGPAGEPGWFGRVDFIVDSGTRPSGGSTIFDLSEGEEPRLIRAGLGGTELLR